MEKLSGDQKKDMSLIGQFGVGFYSVFMVADKVILTTRRLGASEPAMRWESSGDGSYTLEEAAKEDRGTELEIHVKDGEEEFLEDWRIRSIIRKYSEYIPHPIYLLDKDGKEERLNDKPPAVAPLQVRHHQGAVRGVLQAPRLRPGGPAGLVPQPGGGGDGIHHPPVRPVQGPLRSVPAGAAERPQPLREARLHHERLQGAGARPTCAS